MQEPMRYLPGLALLLIAGCGPNDSDPGPGGVTVGEARALDEAAETLEQRPLPAEALPSQPAAPQPAQQPEESR